MHGKGAEAIALKKLSSWDIGVERLWMNEYKYDACESFRRTPCLYQRWRWWPDTQEFTLKLQGVHDQYDGLSKRCYETWIHQRSWVHTTGLKMGLRHWTVWSMYNVHIICNLQINRWLPEAVANMVKMVGAKPIYCDCAEGSVNPGVAELAEKATPRTKAVIVCHTYGAVSESLKWGRAASTAEGLLSHAFLKSAFQRHPISLRVTFLAPFLHHFTFFGARAKDILFEFTWSCDCMLCGCAKVLLAKTLKQSETFAQRKAGGWWRTVLARQVRRVSSPRETEAWPFRTFVKPWVPGQTMESWWGPLATLQWPRHLDWL